MLGQRACISLLGKKFPRSGKREDLFFVAQLEIESFFERTSDLSLSVARACHHGNRTVGIDGVDGSARLEFRGSSSVVRLASSNKSEQKRYF